MKRLIALLCLAALAFSAPAQNSTRWNFAIAIPEGNWQSYAAPDGRNDKLGFLGFALELKYYYADNNAASVKFGYLMDSPKPFGVTIAKQPSSIPGFSGVTKHAYGYFLFLENDYLTDFGLNLKYGLSLTAMTRTKMYWEDGIPNDKKSYISKPVEIGLAGGVDYISPWGLFAGAQYAPSFLSFGKGGARLEYAHIAFMDLGFMLGNLDHPVP